MAAMLRNHRIIVTPSLLRTFCSSVAEEKPSILPYRKAKSAIKSETDPDKLADLFLKSTDLPRFYRDRSLFDLSVRKLARSQRFDLVEQILERQRETPLLKTEGFWIRIIMLYSKAGMLDQAISTFDKMEELGCNNPSEKSFCALLSACLENRRFGLVHQYFESVPPKIGIVPGVIAHNLVMRAFCEEKSIKSAHSLLEKMEKEKGLKPTIASYNILLGAYLRNGDETKFDELFKEVSKKGFEPNLVTYNLRIARLCKDKECIRAKKMLDEMVSKGIQPNLNSYNTIIDGFCKIADLESAKKVFESMSGSVSPNSVSYITLIRHLVQEGEFELALEMCKESLEKKWVPPFSSMEGLVKGLVNMSKTDEAKEATGLVYLSKTDEAKELVEKMKKRLRGSAKESWTKIEGLLPLP